MPDGGIDQDTRGMCSYFSFDARYTLLDGIVGLPALAGDYNIGVQATSVDLDTGNGTDNVAPHPRTYADIFVVSIVDTHDVFMDGFESDAAAE